MDRRTPTVIILLGAAMLAACTGTSGPSGAGGQPDGSSTASAEVPSPATGQGGTGQPVADWSGIQNLLAPGDFTAVGVTGAATPQQFPLPEVSGVPNAAALWYADKSGATGGIELDVVQGEDSAGMDDVFIYFKRGVLGLTDADKIELSQADKAAVRTDMPNNAGGGRWAGIAVQKGRLAFLIAIPSSASAETQLVSVAKLVLERASALF